MTDIATIAARDGLTADDVHERLICWCYPVAWAVPAATEKALANEPTWRQWCDVDYPKLRAAGYYNPRTTPERMREIAAQYREGTL